MNKFGCREDENYTLVIDRLQRLHRQAKRVVSERWGSKQFLIYHFIITITDADVQQNINTRINTPTRSS
jgi:hypothetical protein